MVSLIEAGDLSLDTAARDVLGADLPLISYQVTIEHLLAHRSGIGDYLDEEAVHITD
jgi:CubicO group peptidase (beta-lactamase class C family)